VGQFNPYWYSRLVYYYFIGIIILKKLTKKYTYLINLKFSCFFCKGIPLFLFYQTLQLAQCNQAGNFLLENQIQTAKQRSMICHFTEHVSTAPVDVCFTHLHLTNGIVLGDVRLACSCLAMEYHYMNLPPHSFLCWY